MGLVPTELPAEALCQEPLQSDNPQKRLNLPLTSTFLLWLQIGVFSFLLSYRPLKHIWIEKAGGFAFLTQSHHILFFPPLLPSNGCLPVVFSTVLTPLEEEALWVWETNLCPSPISSVHLGSSSAKSMPHLPVKLHHWTNAWLKQLHLQGLVLLPGTQVQRPLHLQEVRLTGHQHTSKGPHKDLHSGLYFQTKDTDLQTKKDIKQIISLREKHLLWKWLPGSLQAFLAIYEVSVLS